MKTSFDIPESELEELMRNTKAKSKQLAIMTAVKAFNLKHRKARLVKLLGTCDNFITLAQLKSLRKVK